MQNIKASLDLTFQGLDWFPRACESFLGLAWASLGLAEASLGLAKAVQGLAVASQSLAWTSQGLDLVFQGLDLASLGLDQGDVHMDRFILLKNLLKKLLNTLTEEGFSILFIIVLSENHS